MNVSKYYDRLRPGTRLSRLVSDLKDIEIADRVMHKAEMNPMDLEPYKKAVKAALHETIEMY